MTRTEARPQCRASITGQALQALLRIKKAVGGTSRQAIITALYRYEADLIDEGKIRWETKPKEGT